MNSPQLERSQLYTQVFYAPVDVYLADDAVVQPDILVVCDPAKLETKGCVGAPDL